MTAYPDFQAFPDLVLPGCMPRYSAASFDVVVGSTGTTNVGMGTSCSNGGSSYSILDTDLVTDMNTAYAWLS